MRSYAPDPVNVMTVFPSTVYREGILGKCMVPAEAEMVPLPVRPVTVMVPVLASSLPPASAR